MTLTHLMTVRSPVAIHTDTRSQQDGCERLTTGIGDEEVKKTEEAMNAAAEFLRAFTRDLRARITSTHTRAGLIRAYARAHAYAHSTRALMTKKKNIYYLLYIKDQNNLRARGKITSEEIKRCNTEDKRFLTIISSKK